MTARLLLLVLLAFLAARFLVLLARHAAAAYRAGAWPPPAARSEPLPGVPLVACGRCGVLVPQPRARRDGGDAHLCRACGGG